MSKTDVFDLKTIIINLDKPRVLRFTMRVIFELEQKYGSMRAAIDCLYSGDAEQSVMTAVDFLSYLTGLTKKRLDEVLTVSSLIEARLRIPLAMEAAFPDIDEYKERAKNQYESNDWDNLYFIGRYCLLMSDKEFWNTTPRRFDKLYYLWLVANGKIEPEREVFMGEMQF
jgi:hypothetical protein